MNQKQTVPTGLRPHLYMAQNTLQTIITRHRITITALLLASMLLFGFQTVRAEDRRIVTIFVEGQEMAVPTTASTVSEVLERIGVEVYENDLVEPGMDEDISSESFNINVYRARPVTVIDGDERYVVMSPFQSPRRIAESTGLTIYDEDTFRQERVTDFVAHGGLGVKLHITRSQPVTISLYGEEVKVRTQATTVGALLEEKGIELGENESVKPTAGTSLKGVKDVFVLRTGTEVVSKEVAIDFPIEVVKDTAKEVGYSAVRTPGEEGKKTVTYEIKKENGKEVSRKVLQEVVTKQPKKQVVVEGTKVVAPTASVSGSKEDWLRASGIPADQWSYVDFIVTKESGWNPNAVNPSSGACGLAQALPCSKVGAGATDPVAALQWQYQYVNGRYGGYAGAYAFWLANSWY